jgi:hypothetical protein
MTPDADTLAALAALSATVHAECVWGELATDADVVELADMSEYEAAAALLRARSAGLIDADVEQRDGRYVTVWRATPKGHTLAPSMHAVRPDPDREPDEDALDALPSNAKTRECEALCIDIVRRMVGYRGEVTTALITQWVRLSRHPVGFALRRAVALGWVARTGRGPGTRYRLTGEGLAEAVHAGPVDAPELPPGLAS